MGNIELDKNGSSGPALSVEEGDYVVAETDCGTMVCWPRDTGVSRALLRYREFAAGELAVYRDLLKDSDTVVDVGANIGAVSVPIASWFPTSSIYAFEPQPAFHALLTLNLARFPNATVLASAVGSRTGSISVPLVDLSRSGNYGSLSLTERSGVTVPSPLLRLDDFFKLRGRLPRLIKIDVEGMEADVLAGTSGLIHSDLIISVEADRRDAVVEWLAPALASGAKCFLLFPTVISRINPRHDAGDSLCRQRSVQIFIFYSDPPDSFAHQYGGMAIQSVEDYLARFPQS